MRRRLLAPLVLAAACALPPAAQAIGEGGLRVPVKRLVHAPKLDGDSADWHAQGAKWLAIPTTSPSFVDSPDDQQESHGFQPRPEIMAAIVGDRIYFALRWHDDRADTFYRRWVEQGGKYRRDTRRDDMVALRFHTAGEFSDCMLSGRDYTVDVWRWSAGRSQLAGMADDMQHVFSLKPIELAAEYATEHGTLYIKKTMDEGSAGWHTADRPPAGTTGVKLGIAVDGPQEGSRADVAAFGEWREGRWTLELSRKLDTGDPEDVRFAAGKAVTGQLAFFNPGYRMQKQITPVLRIEMPD